jgi:hypothetical protein
MEGKPLVYKSGDREGEPRKDYFMAIAVEKTNPYVGELKSTIEGVARKAFPDLHGPDGTVKPGVELSMKITDGDSTKANKKGKRPCDKEGYPGCWVFGFTTSNGPVDCYTKGGAQRIADPKEIKTGYYVRINGSAAGNKSTSNPGVYLNPNMVELVAYGEEINSRPSGSDVFGGAPEEALPAGATAAPQDSSAPTAPVADAPPPPPTDTAAERTYEYNGKVYTHSQLLGFGWNEKQISAAKLLP